MTPDEIRQPADLDGLDKDGLIAFLKSECEGKIKLWNAWRSANDWAPVDLEGADLHGVHLEKANLAVVHLEGANLEGAHLEMAKLIRTHLEGADLRGAHLEKANLYGAHLERAKLEKAHLKEAPLFYAHLEGANLRDAHLEGADLFKAHLEGADLAMAHLERAALVGAHLKGANLAGAYLQGSMLRLVHLEGANLVAVRLEEANLCLAHLRDVALSSVISLRGVKLYQTYFWGVLSLRYEQFLDEKGNSTIWEETQGRFSQAKDVYKTLKGYFEDAGDYEGANWAYVREQVMEKLMCAPRGVRWMYPGWKDKFNDAFCQPAPLEWLRLEFAEKIANYGDSLLRPALWLLAVIVGFALVYMAFGMVTAMPGCGYEELSLVWRDGCAPTRNLLHSLWFSLGAMTTLDIGYLQPYLPAADALRPIETLLGIALTGLFGFVLGNRLRYS